MILAGTAGLLLAGTVADAWMQRGTRDAYVRTILFSIVCILPCAVALGFTTNDVVGIIVMALAVFFSAFQGGLAGGTLQLMTPNRMRGQVTAVYPRVGAVHGWQLTFFIVGLPGLLVALLILGTVREPQRKGVIEGTADAIPLPEVVRYLWDRRSAYGGHIIGISIFIPHGERVALEYLTGPECDG